MTNKSFFTNFEESLILQRLWNFIAQNKIIKIKGLLGSSLSFYCSAIIKKSLKPSLFVFNNKEETLYFLNDIETLNPGKKIFYFPEISKESYTNKDPNNYNLLQRTEVIEHLNFSKNKNSIIVTHINAIAVNQINKTEIKKNSINLKLNQNISFDKLNEQLFELEFRREDFVLEPGEFAVRGGILDIFPYSSQTPFRIEFFGDEITRIRSFDIESQRSDQDHSRVKIISNIQVSNESKNIQNIFEILFNDTIIFFQSLKLFNSQLESIVDLAKVNYENCSNRHEFVSPENLYVNLDLVNQKLQNFKIIEFNSISSKVDFKINIQPQPSFNKSFNLLFSDITKKKKEGYRVNLCCTNNQQKNRLRQIFEDLDNDGIVEPVVLPLSAGFIDLDNKIIFYTDHQIFERYHKFKFRKRFNNKLSIALKQLNNLNKGDYVTHIDHGIGKFGGLQQIEVDGKMQESIKIIYGERDVLFLSVHAIHKISKYNGKDGKVPRLYKLGSKAWALLKQKTKKNVKKIAYDLIKVYAERKQKKGFKYDKDSYLQNELEASFIYEDTEDQLKVTQEIKNDMESEQPMDRLV